MLQREERFTARRLLRQDAPQIMAMYAAAGRDSVWLEESALRVLMRVGEVWGGFLEGRLCLCGGFCPLDAPFALPRAVLDTGLVMRSGTLFVPMAAAPCSTRYAAQFLDLLTAHCAHLHRAVPPEGLYGAVPVKTGEAFLAGYFEARFLLLNIRPLVQLRPHYIFTAGGVQTQEKESIMIPIQETLALSRALENGFCGTALHRADGDTSICLERIKEGS